MGLMGAAEGGSVGIIGDDCGLAGAAGIAGIAGATAVVGSADAGLTADPCSDGLSRSAGGGLTAGASAGGGGGGGDDSGRGSNKRKRDDDTSYNSIPLVKDQNRHTPFLTLGLFLSRKTSTVTQAVPYRRSSSNR